MKRISEGLKTLCLCLVVSVSAIFVVVALNSDGGIESNVDLLRDQDANSRGGVAALPRLGSQSVQAGIIMSPQTLSLQVDNVHLSTGFDDPMPDSPPFLSDVLIWSNSQSQLHPRIAVDSETGYLWTAFTHFNGADEDMHVAYSEDLGRTWVLNASVSNSYNESKPAITISNGTIMVFYEHDEPGREQWMRCLRSQDNGQTWESNHLDWDWTNDPGRERQENFDNLDVSSTRPGWIHVVADSYHPDDSLRRISFAWSDDDGDSWMAIYVLSAYHPGEDLMRPVIMENTVDNYMHIAFERWNATEAGFDVVWWVLDHDSNFQASWTSGRWDGGNTNVYPDLWVRDDYAYLIWQNGTTNSDLSGFYSDDGGMSVSRQYVTSQNGFDERYPAVFVDESYTFHVSCMNNTSIMYMNNTDPLTQPWQYTKADDAPGNVVDEYRATDLLYYADSPGIVWHDDRRGNNDIFFTALGTNIVQYTITKNPISGIGDILVDSVPCTAPCIFDWEVGSNHTLEAPSTMADPLNPDEMRYAFSDWSDGGARVHNVTVGPVGETITANYDTEYNVTITTVPSGLNVTIDASPYVAPQTMWWPLSSVHIIEADSPQAMDPWTRYTYVSWSDGGARSHPITVLGSSIRTAYFDIECIVNITTVPVGLDVTVDGVTYSSPVFFWWFNGSVHNIMVPTLIPVDPFTAYIFSFWSDGGAADHDVTVLCPMSDLIAYFSTAWNVSFETSPSGLEVDVDGFVYDTSTPTWFFFEHLSNHTIGAPSPQPINPTSQYAFANWSDSGTQYHNITVNSSATHTAYFEIEYRIDIYTNPTDLNITVDGVEYMSPYSHWCDAGSSIMIGAPSPQYFSPDTRYSWINWSDLGAQVHPIVCNGAASYTANFVAQYLTNVSSDPQGLLVEVNGLVYTAPHLGWYDAGSMVLLNAPSPQISGDTRAVFDHWSDGQPQSHQVTIVSPATFVAFFNTQYLLTITSSPVTGLEIEVDGIVYVTEHQFWCDVGATHTIKAISPQPAGPDSRYFFTNWSDGGAQTHVIMCGGPETYTAFYTLEHIVTITTNPSGLRIQADGVNRSSPYLPWWEDGSTHNICALSPQDLVPGSSRYVWILWSDAGAQCHDVTVTGPLTYVASFQLEYRITITTDPEGLNITADGVEYEAPYVVWWAEAANYMIGVPSPQYASSDARYVFNSWSDGGAQNHSLFVGMSATYTAYMDAQYKVVIGTDPPFNPPTSAWLDSGSAIMLSAQEYVDVGPGERYRFVAWNIGGPREQTVIITGPMTIIAYYSLQYELTIVTVPLGLEVQVDSVVYTAPMWFDDESMVTVNATSPQAGGPGQQYVFVDWSDGGAQSHLITLDAPISLTATFTLEYEITVLTDPIGLNVSVDGVSKTTPATLWWVGGTEHILSVLSPQAGGMGIRYSFDMWSDGVTTLTRGTSVTGPMTFQANFTAEYYLTVHSDYGSTSGEGWYQDGVFAFAGLDTDTVLAGQTRHLFQSWSGDATGTDYSSSNQILMDAPKTALAVWQTEHFLTVNSEYGDPLGEGWYEEGSEGQFSVTTPYLEPGITETRHLFEIWSGDSTSTSPTASILMDAPKEVTAVWTTQHYLTIIPTYGNAEGEGWYDESSIAMLSLDEVAIEVGDTRYVCMHWGGDATGDCASSDPLTMDGPKTAIAVWKTQYRLRVLSDYGITSGGGWYDDGSSAIAGLSEQYVDGPPGTRYAFDLWSGDATGSDYRASNPIIMEAPMIANATWRTEFYFTVTSAYGNASGEGWYPEGYVVRARLESDIVSIAAGERAVFQQWAGDTTGADYYQSNDLVLDVPKTAVALWKRQYLVSFESVPAGLTFSLDGVENAAPAAFWLDSDSTHSISAEERQKVDGKDFSFGSWSDGGALGHNLVVTDATTITLTYDEVAKPDVISQWLPWIGLIILIVIITLVVVVLLAKRRSKETEEPEEVDFEEETEALSER